MYTKQSHINSVTYAESHGTGSPAQELWRRVVNVCLRQQSGGEMKKGGSDSNARGIYTTEAED